MNSGKQCRSMGSEMYQDDAVQMFPPFSHIYVERQAMESPQTARILEHFPVGTVVPVRHYKDLFNRGRQRPELQRQSPSLVLARKTGTLLYPGAPVCQSFGNEHFYYTSLAMNCLFDCDYCFLKGMYPSGHMVVFVNLEDYGRELETLLAEHPVYLCVSYDTDLCAIESWTGYVEAFHALIRNHPGLTVEVRTKAACTGLLRRLEPEPGMIFAFTLSPQVVIDACEHRTPSLRQRLETVRTGLQAGHRIRLCFDPMLLIPDWETAYAEMLDCILEILGPDGLRRVQDVSIGSFRIAAGYLKPLRHQAPESAVIQYPFCVENGYAQYPDAVREGMETRMMSMLAPYLVPEQIFRWKE